MKRRIAPFWIVALLPLSIGFVIALYLCITAPESWEGFGWNPRVVEAIKVLFKSLVVSITLVLVLVVLKRVAVLWRVGRPLARIAVLIICGALGAAAIIGISYLLAN